MSKIWNEHLSLLAWCLCGGVFSVVRYVILRTALTWPFSQCSLCIEAIVVECSSYCFHGENCTCYFQAFLKRLVSFWSCSWKTKEKSYKRHQAVDGWLWNCYLHFWIMVQMMFTGTFRSLQMQLWPFSFVCFATVRLNCERKLFKGLRSVLSWRYCLIAAGTFLLSVQFCTPFSSCVQYFFICFLYRYMKKHLTDLMLIHCTRHLNDIHLLHFYTDTPTFKWDTLQKINIT